MIDEHMRFKVWSKAQHPYNHQAVDIGYAHAALPGVTTGQGVWDWIVAVLYPQDKPAVANIAALPAVGNTLGDYRVVNDTGAGQAGGFRWEQREGDAAAKWYQIYAMNWGFDSIMSGFLNQTQNIYVNKYGYDDTDSSGIAVAGTLAGQTVYGGRTAGNNLTLYPNAGDGAGAVTGFIQVAGTTRPIGTSNTLDLGTSSNKFRTGYFGTSVLAGTMTLSGGTVADSSGAITFGALNLTTTGFSKAGLFLAGDGTAAAPGMAFTAELGTGWYRPGASEVSLALGGTQRYLFAGGQVTGPQGSAGAPALGFLADAASGLYQPTTSQVALATGGTQRFLLDASGNATVGAKFYLDQTNSRLGIGTLSPSTDLHIFKAASPQVRLDSQNSAGSTPGEIQFYAARASNANLAALDDMGYLDWYGRANGASTWLAGIQGRYRGNGTTLLADIIFATANGSSPAERMRIRYDGNVGIGVSDPQVTLDVTGGVGQFGNIRVGTNALSAQNTNGGITLTPNGAGRVVAGVGLDPSADGGVNLGQAATRWDTIFLKTAIGDGTNTIPMATLMSLRGINSGVASGNGIFWNGTQWVAADPDTEVFHDSISHLTGVGTDGDAGHSQFVVAAGRASAQTIKGGTASSANLTLDSTAHASKGKVLFNSDLGANSDATQNIGGASNRFNDLFMVGQGKGFRAQNFTTAGRDAASASYPGRLYWDSTVSAVYADNGGAWLKQGTLVYYNQDASGWTGSVASVTYDVSSVFSATYPAYKALWQFQDNSNNRQILQGALISFPSTTQVTVAFDNNLAAGTYSLVGVG